MRQGYVVMRWYYCKPPDLCDVRYFCYVTSVLLLRYFCYVTITYIINYNTAHAVLCVYRVLEFHIS